MRYVLALAALVAAFVFLAPLMAGAQSVTMMNATPCVPVAALPGLTAQYNEHPIGAGLSSDGKSLYYIIVSESGTFTLIRRDASGMACLIGGGNGWQVIAPPVAGRGL